MTLGQWFTVAGLSIAVLSLLYSKRKYDLMQIDAKNKRKSAERKYKRQITGTFARQKREMQALEDLAKAYQKKYELLHDHVKMLDKRVYENKKK